MPVPSPGKGHHNQALPRSLILLRPHGDAFGEKGRFMPGAHVFP
ncbi:conserved hypothetical protein [delta proteobacterium NaphS2]|nr:conserved hypothetical protein [delta proteobacterium NaphS2]